MAELNHISECNLNYLNHDLKHIKLALFRCNICNVGIIFSQTGIYWKVDRIYDDYECSTTVYECSTTVYEISCGEECIKKLLE